jgi:hypothetical protein
MIFSTQQSTHHILKIKEMHAAEKKWTKEPSTIRD